MKYAQEDVKKLGSILGIWAHPDDEAWASAGLMRMAALNGQKLGIITATKGSAGQTADEQQWPQNDLARIREAELKECLSCIGEVEQHWLLCKDGQLAETDEHEQIQKIIAIINEFQPDTIITFEEQGITGHEDHCTIHAWAVQAANQADYQGDILLAATSTEAYERAGKQLDAQFDIYFNLAGKPKLIAESDADICLQLDGGLLQCKLNCIKAHASQSSMFFADDRIEKQLSMLVSTEAYTKHE